MSTYNVYFMEHLTKISNSIKFQSEMSFYDDPYRSFLTERPWQTMQTQIRLLFEEQGLHCSLFLRSSIVCSGSTRFPIPSSPFEQIFI